MNTIAVLTGDIVGSQQINDKPRLSRTLDDTLTLLERRFAARSDRFRGDGFQIAVNDPGDGVTAAVLLRAALIQQSPSRQVTWDARIAVAVGNGEVPTAARFAEAEGDAFVRSGRSLDALSETPQRLVVVTGKPALDQQLALLTRFADDILGHWSHYSAEVAYHSLLHDESQQALARRLQRTQPTINRRLVAARWPLIRDYIGYVGQQLGEA